MDKKQNAIDTPLICSNGKPIISLSSSGNLICYGTPTIKCHMCGKEISGDFWRMHIHNKSNTIPNAYLLCDMICVQNKINEYYKDKDPSNKYTDMTFDIKFIKDTNISKE